MTEALRETEHFNFLNFAFDVSACEKGIAAKAVKFKGGRWDREFIRAYAEQLLGLRRDMPDDAFSGRMIHVNVGYARSLGATADAAAVLMVETVPGKGVLHLDGKSYFLANGNHRMAKAYFEDAEGIDVHTVARRAAAPFIL